MFAINDLNEMQYKAVTHVEGPLLVLAGAGSGKTRVITYRIAYLCSEIGISPWNILAITFTNKAAGEMKERLHGLLGDVADDMWIRTFHSACVRILRRDIDKIGYDKGFTIYDSDDQKRLIKDCVKQLNLDEKTFSPSLCISYISSAKDEFVEPDEFIATYHGNLKMEAIGKVYKLYQEKLKASNCVDFDDLIILTVKLFLDCPEVLSYYQDKFMYIHIDEYQDTNNAQYKLVSLLAAKYKNLCVVGDDDQSIYKFRGANIANILSFEKTFPNATVIRLEQNYRSSGNILDAANSVIKNNTGRKGKTLWTDSGKGDKIVKYYADNERDEAMYIASEIQRLNKYENIPFSDMTVLYRMNAQARTIEERLINEAVPYRIIAGHRFYDSKEIKDIIAYLRVINNITDNISLLRIINEPKRKIGKTTTDKATELAAENGISIYEFLRDNSAILSTAAAAAADGFIKIIESLREKVSSMGVSEFISEVLDKTGYAAQYMVNPNDIEARGRVENLQEFVSVAVNYEKDNESPNLADFLDNISLVSDIDNYDEDQDTVSLMTLHSAKGLEFPVVFLCGMEEGVFPGQRSMFEKEELEEERRLCYVGITRAQKKLYLTHARERMLFGTTTANKPSRFTKEIPEELYDEKFGFAQRSAAPSFIPQRRENTVSFKPTFTTAKPDVQQNAKFDFAPGDRVLHGKFGEGTVLTAVPVGNDMKIEIAFDKDGTKTLLALYAKLKKIN
ncbi:MAG: DNA helicase PcrA [Clostridia bacterium]|nr:DNA helicase PcrA [Clostridia bacterium]